MYKCCKCKWLVLLALCFMPVFMLSACSSSSDSKPAADNTAPPTTAVTKATVSGSITFPALGSLVGKQVGKQVALALPATATVTLQKLDGTIVVSQVLTSTGNGTFSYSFDGIDTADYLVKVVSGTQVLKALLDKGSISTATTRNIDTVSTTTVIVAEKKMNVAIGSLGEAGNLKTSDDIATINPAVLEFKIQSAVTNMNATGGLATASQENIDLANIVNIVAATVFNNVDTTSFMAGTSTAPVATNQFTYTAGASVMNAAATVTSSATSTALASTATSYTAPAAGTVAFTSRITDWANGSGIAGATVTTVGLTPEITTTTDANGSYSLVGIAANTPFTVKMSKTNYTDSYSAQISLAKNDDSSNRPFALILPNQFTATFGSSAGTGVIQTRVVDSTDLVSGFMGGVVVTATDKNSATTYPVVYFSSATAAWDASLTSTDTNGKYMIKNVPAGSAVNVTASKSGFTFNTRIFDVKADSWSQGRIVGTAVVSAASTTKTVLMAGTYEFRSDNNGTSANYYSVRRMGLATDGASLTETTLAWYDKASKAWMTTLPAGFPVNTGKEYTLTATGWVLASDGPADYKATFNADGTALVTNSITGVQLDIKVAEVNVTGQSVSSTLGLQNNNDFPPILKTAPSFPAGSVRYDMIVTERADSYKLWSNNYSGYTPPATLAAVPAYYTPSTTPGTNSNRIYIDTNSSGSSYYAQFVAGSTTAVNIYLDNSSQTTQILIGTATAAIKTIALGGKEILEIEIPLVTRTTYKLRGNPIFSVFNSVVMEGRHAFSGSDDKGGGSSFNNVAINHMKANIDTTLAKGVVAKSISKAILGR